MLKVLRIILSISVVTLGSYSLITRTFDLLPYSFILLGFLSLVVGLIKLKKDKKSFWGYINIGASAFVFFVLIYTSQFS
ncbi:hypothetical protein CR203_21475 [Salipaludibacillus neizhouensis]|uniref:DUF3953 domain-containing protein n=1 Tax=Salipaludibacillus neizhouensis TaxID=885475 RepID=A0A3A9K224_9BACI|nr:DUF3953 domain-containing protein [Salipaludibacillus neizhouensis]RKL65248.1 hypothetical protein CR203_21475 [Salipaludibacillus neizhouensis]